MKTNSNSNRLTFNPIQRKIIVNHQVVLHKRAMNQRGKSVQIGFQQNRDAAVHLPGDGNTKVFNLKQ